MLAASCVRSLRAGGGRITLVCRTKSNINVMSMFSAGTALPKPASGIPFSGMAGCMNTSAPFCQSAPSELELLLEPLYQCSHRKRRRWSATASSTGRAVALTFMWVFKGPSIVMIEEHKNKDGKFCSPKCRQWAYLRPRNAAAGPAVSPLDYSPSTAFQRPSTAFQRASNGLPTPLPTGLGTALPTPALGVDVLLLGPLKAGRLRGPGPPSPRRWQASDVCARCRIGNRGSDRLSSARRALVLFRPQPPAVRHVTAR